MLRTAARNRGVMKDNYMIFVLIAVMLTPFFPVLLKSKCPQCKKRKLEHLETVTKEIKDKATFITYYVCHHCQQQFMRVKSGPLKATVIPKEELSKQEELASV